MFDIASLLFDPAIKRFSASYHVMLEVCHSIFSETPGRKGKLVPLSSQDVSAYIYCMYTCANDD